MEPNVTEAVSEAVAEGAATLGGVVEDIGTIFTAAMGWVGDVAGVVASQPLLLLGVVVGFVGLGVGLFKRLLS